MTLTKILPLSLLLVSCQWTKSIRSKASPSSPPTTSSPSNPVEKPTYELAVDDGMNSVLNDILRGLLMPQERSGEVFYNPGGDRELSGIAPGIPNLRFTKTGKDLVLMRTGEWLKASGPSNEGLYVNLSLQAQAKRKASNPIPNVTHLNPKSLIQLFTLRLEEFGNAATFKLASLLPVKGLGSIASLETNLPYFFTITNNYPLSLFYEACEKVASFGHAIQLKKGIKPEASIEISLQCEIQLNPVNFDDSRPGFTLVELPLPWKKPNATEAIFTDLNAFFEEPTFRPLKSKP